MNHLSNLRESVTARLRKIATGGLVALVLGGLLATGITVSASALEPTDALFEMTVTAGGEPVAGARVEVLEPQDGTFVYRTSGTTDATGHVNLTEWFDDYKPTLDSNVGYAVSISTARSHDDGPATTETCG